MDWTLQGCSKSLINDPTNTTLHIKKIIIIIGIRNTYQRQKPGFDCREWFCPCLTILKKLLLNIFTAYGGCENHNITGKPLQYKPKPRPLVIRIIIITHYYDCGKGNEIINLRIWKLPKLRRVGWLMHVTYIIFLGAKQGPQNPRNLLCNITATLVVYDPRYHFKGAKKISSCREVKVISSKGFRTRKIK